MGDRGTRSLASFACILAAVGFVATGAAILLGQAWWRPVVVGTAVFSTALCLLFWDGRMQRLDNQGAIAVIINVAILVAVLILRWPHFGF